MLPDILLTPICAKPPLPLRQVDMRSSNLDLNSLPGALMIKVLAAVADFDAS